MLNVPGINLKIPNFVLFDRVDRRIKSGDDLEVLNIENLIAVIFEP